MLEGLQLPDCIKTNYTLDDFEPISVLGRGNYGKVYLAREKATGKQWAIKIMNKTKIMTKKQLDSLLNEIQHNAVLSGCPHICAIAGVFEDDDSIYIVMERCGRELFQVLAKLDIPLDLKLEWFWEVARAIQCCHSRDIIHGDIKPENVLIDNRDHAHLIDFGFSQHADHVKHYRRGTPPYFATEITGYNGRPVMISKAVDMWALGILLYEMVSGNPPFDAGDMDGLVRSINTAEISYEKIPTTVQPILEGLLDRDPSTRWTAPDLVGYNNRLLQQ